RAPRATTGCPTRGRTSWIRSQRPAWEGPCARCGLGTAGVNEVGSGSGGRHVSQRKARVEHALRDVLTELIAAEVKDPRVRAATPVTVTRVELNVALAVAHVYVSVVAADDAVADGVIAGLTKAAGFLRGPATRRLALQRAPELRFRLDASVDMTEKL